MAAKKVLKSIFMFQVVLALTTLFGCATVPKESVTLSAGIGKGINESRRSHIALLNTYFTLKQETLDHWIESEYAPKFVANIQAGLKKGGMPGTLAPEQLADVVKAIIKERDQRQADLEKTRLLLFEKIDERYSQLTLSNAGITALLQSLADVKEATASTSGMVKTDSGGTVDLAAIDKKISEYLKQMGTVAGIGTGLNEQVRAIIEKKGE